MTTLDSVDTLLSRCLQTFSKLRAMVETLVLMAPPSNVHTPPPQYQQVSNKLHAATERRRYRYQKHTNVILHALVRGGLVPATAHSLLIVFRYWGRGV